MYCAGCNIQCNACVSEGSASSAALQAPAQARAGTADGDAQRTISRLLKTIETLSAAADAGGGVGGGCSGGWREDERTKALQAEVGGRACSHDNLSLIVATELSWVSGHARMLVSLMRERFQRLMRAAFRDL